MTKVHFVRFRECTEITTPEISRSGQAANCYMSFPLPMCKRPGAIGAMCFGTDDSSAAIPKSLRCYLGVLDNNWSNSGKVGHPNQQVVQLSQTDRAEG